MGDLIMLLRKTAIFAGVLAISSGAAMAQGVDLGARAIVIDNFNNQRALEEQQQFRPMEGRAERPMATRNGARINQGEALEIARSRGVDEVGDVRRTRGAWMIDGVDGQGEAIVVRVSSRGEVLDVRNR